MGGGASEVLPLRKGGGGGFSHAEEMGGTKSVKAVLMWELKVSAILKQDANSFHSLKGGRETFYLVLMGAQQVLNLHIYHVIAPPFPVVTDWSLTGYQQNVHILAAFFSLHNLYLVWKALLLFGELQINFWDILVKHAKAGIPV